MNLSTFNYSTRSVKFYIAQLRKLHKLAEHRNIYNIPHLVQQIPAQKPPPTPSVYSTETFI